MECARGFLSFGSFKEALEPFAWYNPVDPGATAAGLTRALFPFVAGD